MNEMERTPVKSEFTRTSIFLSAVWDSGFCGSPLGFKDDELPFSRDSFHTFTPLKFTPLNYDSNQNIIQIGKSDIIKQLSFEDSGREKSDRSQLSQSPNYSNRVDFFSRLKKMNCEKIVSNLLSYLPAEDLCRVSCVNKMWRELVLEDVKANRRKRKYLNYVKANIEVLPRTGMSKVEIKKMLMCKRPSSLPKFALKDITNSYQESKVATKYCNSKFNSFFKAGNNVGGPLMKCPSCKYAARRKEDDEYICTHCNYTFCKKCLSPCSKYHKCPMLEIPTLVIGSKQSKRNLKRL